MSQLCSGCRFQNPPGMRFCGNCGAPLAALAAPVNLAPAPVMFVPEQLGVTMGADLLDRFRQAGLEAAGQRRNVTILFADLVGYTEIAEGLDSEEVYDLIQEYIQLLANEVYKYEGIVDKLTGDGLMAIYGAPITHENNAERAVRSALEMQADLIELSKQSRNLLGAPLQMRIGLNTGVVVVGGVGSDYLMDYTAIGDTVNLAQRLEAAAAPGAILVSESVYRQTRPLFDFQPVPGLCLKGISRPVEGYRVTGLKAQPGRVRGLEGLRAPMIGREAELDELKKAAWALLDHQVGQFALLTGEAGLGKSRLKTEFRDWISSYPMRVLEGSSLTYRRSVSYWVFLELLYSYLGVQANTPGIEIGQRLSQRVSEVLGPRAQDTLPYLEHLLSVHPSDPEAAGRIAYLDAGQLRQQIFLAVRDLLVAEARHSPILLVLEDLHWADEASLNLLLFLLEALRTAPLMILAISRPFREGPIDRISTWARKHLGESFHALQLSSLSPDDSEHLLSELLNIPELPAELRLKILERASGIPLYLEEILRMLIDRGALERQAGRWKLVSGEESLGVPETLQGLILARFDRLDPVSRRALQIAAVIGHHFTKELLLAVLARASPLTVRPENMQAGLGRLVERDFIHPVQGAQPDENFAFRHVLVSEAIYSTLLKRERGRLHGQVGAALEVLYATRLDDQVELLARHYSWSDQPDRALHFLILAGQKAARRYANEAAQQHFEAALSLLGTTAHLPGQERQVHIGLGDLLVLAGEYPAAREHYEAAERVTPAGVAGGDWTGRCELCRRIATTFERQGEYEPALQRLGQAEELLAGAQQPFLVEYARVYNDIGWIHFRRGSLEAAETFLLMALSRIEKVEQVDLAASIYNRLGGICFQKDQLDQASQWVRKSLVLREEIGDVVAVARSYNNLGLLDWKRGDWEGALEEFTRSVELHANLGDVEGMVNVHGNLGLLQLDRGNVTAARQHLETALATAQGAGSMYHMGVISLHLSRLYVATRDWRRALEYGHRSIEILKEIGSEDSLTDLYTNIGEAWFGQGDLEQAREWAERASARAETARQGGSPPAQDQGRALRLLGEVQKRQGDLNAAEQSFQASATIFERLANPLEQGRTNLSFAMLFAARGDLERARLILDETRQIFLRLGAQLDLQSVDTSIARCMALSR